MANSTESGPTKAARRSTVAVAVLAVVTLLALALAGPAHRFGLLGLMPAFAFLAISAVAAVLLAVAGLAALLLNARGAGTPGMLLLSGFGLLAGIGLVANYLFWFQRADGAPSIHEISTDVRDPPQFVALLALREDAPNPAEYGGDLVAVQQRLHYPDIDTLAVEQPSARVYEAALATAEALGWQIVSAEQGVGRIEATDTTAFFGFTDDVVIRVRERSGVTEVDVRSKSRVGVGDLGTNARRVREYLTALEERLTLRPIE